MNCVISSFLSSGFMLILLWWLTVFFIMNCNLVLKLFICLHNFPLLASSEGKGSWGDNKNRPPAGILDAALAAEYKV